LLLGLPLRWFIRIIVPLHLFCIVGGLPLMVDTFVGRGWVDYGDSVRRGGVGWRGYSDYERYRALVLGLTLVERQWYCDAG
jgi:hypothetical protein